MLNPDRISLNALRVFLMAARHLSIRRAAQDLSVTPGAVSHQIRSLERALGVELFERRNNAIALTEAGQRLVQQAEPGLHILRRALDDLASEAGGVRVRASMSFAMRWLIPRLHLFKARHPDVQIHLETVFDITSGVDSAADVTLLYCRGDALPPGAEVLFDDLCCPYVAPDLLGRSDAVDLGSIPALQCAKGNCDWQLWQKRTGRQGSDLHFTERFDLDDAAIRSAALGLGMVLTTQMMIEDELDQGRLVPVPGCDAASIGSYAMLAGPRDTGTSRRFQNWLREMAG